MTRRLLPPTRWVAAVLAAAACLAAAPDSAVTLNLAATPGHPRNSEGSFVTLRSGQILFCYSQFSGGDDDFSPCRLAAVTSTDGGRSWSEPRVLFTPEPGTMEMSASLLRLASGRLALFSLIKHGTLECLPYLRLSSDEGVTWTAPRRILAAPGYYVLNNDRVIQTASGRLIAPLGYHRTLKARDDGTEGSDLRAIALWLYSDDEGTTWQESPTWWTLPAATQTGLQEPGAVELAGGRLYAWARTDQGCQYEFRSADNGVTWSPPAPSGLVSPASPASIKRVPGTSTLLAVYNDHSGQFPFTHASNPYRGRNPLVAATSVDGGATWRTAKLLENDPRRDYCYVAIHFDGDAALFAYLAYGGDPGTPGALVIRRVKLSWLLAPDDPAVTRARQILHEILDQDETWVKIHAAEALVSGGEASAIRARCLALRSRVDSLPYRVGVWRVLANTSPTAADRAACIAEVEKIYLDPAAPDQSQAVETLGKLHHRLTGAVLAKARRAAAENPPATAVMPLWALGQSDEPGAWDRLVQLLRAPEPRVRLQAAYALRLARHREPAALRELARVADAEPDGTAAQAYLVGAAFALGADPARLGAWRAQLERIQLTGTVESRFEAASSLLASATGADLPRAVQLLDGPGSDTRIGAAHLILQVHYRE